MSLTFVAKPGHSINGFSVNASGMAYVGDDARLGVSGAFNREFHGASYCSGALAGDGTWSDSTGNGSPNFGTVSGYLYVETTNHYSYEQLVGYNEIPVYIGEYVDVIVGCEPAYDDEGNEIGNTPIYESQTHNYRVQEH